MRKSLDQRSRRYEKNADLAADYLKARGFGDLATDAVAEFRLGVVDEHPLGYLVGRLSIPYVTASGIIGLKYRCMADHDCKTEKCAKYLYDDGEEPRLYNASATLRTAPLIFLTEGELDAVAVATFTGFPACAIPGAQMWAQHRYWARCLSPFRLVILPADGDAAGKTLAKAVGTDVPQLRVVHMPEGRDASDVLASEGSDGFLRRCELEQYIT